MLVAADRVRDLLPILNCERAVEGVLPCQNPPTPMRATQCVLPSACYPVRATQCGQPFKQCLYGTSNVLTPVVAG